MSKFELKTISIEIKGQIGVIYLNRPKNLNAFNKDLTNELTVAFRELNEHPDTVITVLTGKGRFFSAGADIRGGTPLPTTSDYPGDAGKKLTAMNQFAPFLEMMRSVIDHRKVFVLALNGPGVGGGAAWFQGMADIVLAAKGAWLQVPFSALGLVPEGGSIVAFAQSVGVHRANEFLMFGRKASVEEMERWGLVNHIFEAEGFQDKVEEYLVEQLKVNDSKALMETKRLANQPLREGRINAVYNAFDALSERAVDGEGAKRFAAKLKDLDARATKSKL